MENIRQKVRKLEQFSDHIIGCRVMVEAPHRHKHQGALYNVRIDLTVAGGELVVKREPHEDIYVAIRDAFDAAKRQLLSFARKRRGEVKHHGTVQPQPLQEEYAPLAKVSKIDHEEGFGFLETEQGEEIYFTRQELMDADMNDLEIGVRVRYALAQGVHQPQAAAVTLS